MTSFHGDEDEMGTTDHGLSIDEVDRLLDGHVPAGRDDLAGWAADLASLSAAYDRDVDPVDVRRWATEAAALAGLTPTDNGDLAATSGSNAYRPASQVAGLPKRRIPVLNSIAAFLATTLGKVAAAGALVAATTTGGLAATGNLPGQSDGPAPVTVEDDSSDPGVLDAGGLDDDEVDDGCAVPTGADVTVCDDDDDADDDALDDDDACEAADGAVGATAPTDDDDLDDDAVDDDDATDDADDDCETDDVESSGVEADEDADDHDDDADEVESDDAVDDEADDRDDDSVEDGSIEDSSVDDGDDSSDDSSDDSDDSDADEGDGVPQG